MTPAERLIAQMRDQRKSLVELCEGKRVQITRPPENDLESFVTTTEDGRFTLHCELRHVLRYTVGWEGFTEADLVGPAGSSDQVPFAPELWQMVVEDKLDWLRTVAQALLDSIVAHREAKAEDQKN